MSADQEVTNDAALTADVPADALTAHAGVHQGTAASLPQLLDSLDMVRDECEMLAGVVVGAAAKELAMRYDALNITLTMANLHSAQDKAKRDAILAKALRSRVLPWEQSRAGL